MITQTLASILASITLGTASVQQPPKVAQSYNCGLATYYDPWYHGRETAMSTPDRPNYYSRYSLTAASWYFQLGEWITVRNTRNSRSVTVQVTDRGGNGLLDLSEAASKELSDDGLPDNFNICVE